MFDGKAFGAEVVEIVRGYVDEQTAPLRAEIADLRAKLAEIPTTIPVPEPPDISAIAATVLEMLPASEPGAPGEDGKDADPEAVRAIVAELVAEIPAPQDGKSVTVDDVAPLIAEAVQKAIQALPAPKDPVGLAGAVIDRTGVLVLTLSDGTTRDLGVVVGRNGEDGKPGEAAFRLEDFDSNIKDGGRFLALSFTAGEMTHTVEHQLDTMIYRGVFKDDQRYQPGDTVTFGGNLYHCNAETSDKPVDGSDCWTLAVRRGRDGKDRKPGE